MAHNNVSFHSARRIAEGEIPAPRPTNSRVDPVGWPALPLQKTTPVVQSQKIALSSREETPGYRRNNERIAYPKSRTRERTVPGGIGNYYAQFNGREEEIDAGRRGLALAASRGTSWSRVVQREAVKDTEYREQDSIGELIESIMLLMRRFPSARNSLIEALTNEEQLHISPSLRGDRSERARGRSRVSGNTEQGRQRMIETGRDSPVLIV